MLARDDLVRITRCLFGLAVGVVCVSLTSGCGGNGGGEAAPVQKVQMQKAQEYMSSYREQMIAANKGKAQAKAQAKAKPTTAEKQSSQ